MRGQTVYLIGTEWTIIILGRRVINLHGWVIVIVVRSSAERETFRLKKK